MKSLETRILAIYDQLSPSERRLAEILLEHQTDLPSYTAAELAHRAGVSKTTAARLIRRLGYRTYEEAKRQVRSMKHWGSPLLALDELDGPLGGNGLARQQRDTDVANISKTFQTLDPDSVGRVIEALRRAPRTWILGLRNGYALAHYFRYFVSMVKSDVRLLPEGGLSFGEEFASIAEGDVLVAIAFRRRPKLLRRLLAEARALGATVVLVTDMSASLSARQADILIRCWCRGAPPFESFASAVSVLNFLAASLVVALGDEARCRLERIEQLHDRIDDLAVPGK